MERESQSAYSRLKASGLLDVLQGRVAEANLYRFCQLLEQALPGHPPLGSSASPSDDAVRFRPDPGMGFPGGELRVIEDDPDNPLAPVTVRTHDALPICTYPAARPVWSWLAATHGVSG